MRGTYRGVECRTGEVRLDGKMEKALIYADRPGENDEQALTAAGFADLDNGLWVKKLTLAEYRQFVDEFEQMQKEHIARVSMLAGAIAMENEAQQMHRYGSNPLSGESLTGGASPKTTAELMMAIARTSAKGGKNDRRF